jgi:hypothetical protein
MTDPDDPPFASHEEYLQVVARLHAEAAGDSRWLEVLALMERAIRYEMDRGLPGPERLASRLAGRAGPQAKRTALISDIHGNSEVRLLFVGHAHVPLHIARSSESYGEARSLPVEYNRPVSLEREERYIVCVGSVGYGRDDVGKLRYAIFDRDAWSIEFRALDGPLLPCDHTLRRRFDGPLELQPREEGAG